MRPAAVSPIFLLLLACSPGDPDVVLVEDFLRRSPLLNCTVVEQSIPPASVVRLRPVGDSLLAVMAEGDRELLLLGTDLEPLRRIAWTGEGPSALSDPVDVEILGDSLLAVLDRGRARISFLGLDGSDRGNVRLGFAPHRFLRAGDAWLVSAVALHPGQAELLYRVTPERVSGMGVVPVHMAVPQIKALANTAVLERVAGDRVILAHQFLVPSAYLLDLGDGSGRPRSARTVGTPLSDGVAAAVGYRPEPPFSDESLMRILTPVLDASPDPVGGGLFYLTRSGRRTGDRWEKALVQVDRDMVYRASFLLPVNAGPFVYLPASDEVVVVDEDERWHRCALPRAGAP